MPYHPKACTLLYGVSCLLDAVDGMAARALNQTSKFGAVLDMVTDRCVPTFRCSFSLHMKVERRGEETLADRVGVRMSASLGARHRVCSVSWLLGTLDTPCSSKVSSRSTLPVTTYICTRKSCFDETMRNTVIIEGVADVIDCLRLMVLCRSLATGSTSHKTVKSDVSRILWYYYNDNVGPPLLPHFVPCWSLPPWLTSCGRP